MRAPTCEVCKVPVPERYQNPEHDVWFCAVHNVVLDAPKYQAIISEAERLKMVRALLVDEEANFAEAQKKGFYATYSTTGNALVIVVYYKGGFRNIFDCNVVRRQA